MPRRRARVSRQRHVRAWRPLSLYRCACCRWRVCSAARPLGARGLLVPEHGAGARGRPPAGYTRGSTIDGGGAAPAGAWALRLAAGAPQSPVLLLVSCTQGEHSSYLMVIGSKPQSCPVHSHGPGRGHFYIPYALRESHSTHFVLSLNSNAAGPDRLQSAAATPRRREIPPAGKQKDPRRAHAPLPASPPEQSVAQTTH